MSWAKKLTTVVFYLFFFYNSQEETSPLKFIPKAKIEGNCKKYIRKLIENVFQPTFLIWILHRRTFGSSALKSTFHLALHTAHIQFSTHANIRAEFNRIWRCYSTKCYTCNAYTVPTAADNTHGTYRDIIHSVKKNAHRYRHTWRNANAFDIAVFAFAYVWRLQPTYTFTQFTLQMQ